MDRTLTEEQEDRAAGGDIGIGDGDIAGTNVADRGTQQPQKREKTDRDGLTGGYGTGGTGDEGEKNGR